MDGVSTIGDLNTVFNNTGGWADEPALTIANDVISELISVRFPWKWNRFKIPPFPLTSNQQDYAANLYNIGWVENGKRIDINNTTVPPPDADVYAVRDLAESSQAAAWPFQYCWHYNDQMQQELWPGPGVKYTDPIGQVAPNPENPYTNIIDPSGNILALVTWGTTGLVEPDAGLDAEPGDTVQDGTLLWEVIDPKAQGIRVYPRPPNSGTVWLMRLFAQRKAPTFTTMQQKLDPIPDDYSKWFRDGCVAYGHRYSSNPQVRARFPQMKNDWIAAVEGAARQGDREDENKGFFPDRGVMAPGGGGDTGPIPFRWGWRLG
jgi:hypothetical protein